MKNQILYIWLQLALGLYSRIAGEIFTKFTNIADIYNCDDFSFLGEKREKYIKRLESKDTSSAFEMMKRCEALGVKVTGYYDNLYPKALRRINMPPVVLYSIGDFRDLNNAPCVGIVGTRKMSDYGKEITENFAYTFAKSGVYVISGLAKGIDTAAHRGAIRAGGYTIGILGNPIGDVYPKENIRAFETLYQRGLVISEMYPGCPRTKADFPNRNRLISAISDAILVTEAGGTSGALITARHAIEQGKPLYAVPGSIGSENEGTNRLIKTGISAVTEPQDILAPLLLQYPQVINCYEPSVTAKLRSYGNAGISVKAKMPENPKPKAEMPKAEQTEDEIPKTLAGSNSEIILAALKNRKPMTADELTAETGISVSEVMAELTLMEIDGSVTVSIGGRYTATKA